MHTNSLLIQEQKDAATGHGGPSAGRVAGQEAATVHKGCGGRTASPPFCDLLGTPRDPKGRGRACGFVLCFFVHLVWDFAGLKKSTPDSLSCLWETLTASADGIICTTATAVRKKKDSCVTMNQQMEDFFC